MAFKLRRLIPTLVVGMLAAKGGCVSVCGPNITDAYDDLPADEGLSPSVYNGLNYSDAWTVSVANNSWGGDARGTFAVSPPNVLMTSALSGHDDFANASIAVVEGYAYFGGLYYGCINPVGAIPCNISTTGFDVDGVPVPEVILHYAPASSWTEELTLAVPLKGSPIRYKNATFRVVESGDAFWLSYVLLDNVTHQNCCEQ